MIGGDNADSILSGRKVEAEDSGKTVESLRGRLLAERVASRNAKEEAEQWDNKLIDLENMLKQETKSRNRAEKKLSFLMKKLESLKKWQVSDGSEHSGSADKTDFSSRSSSRLSFSSSSHSSTEESQEGNDNVKSPKDSESSNQKGSNLSVSVVLEPKNEDDVMMGSSSIVSDKGFEDSGKNADENHENGVERFVKDDDGDHYVGSIDNSMAIVPVDMPPKESPKKIDPEVLDATVKEVLDTLKLAKESLQSSMLRRRGINMIKVG